MSDYIIMEGVSASTGEKRYVLQQDAASDCQIRISFDTLDEARARAAHLTKVHRMQQQMYGQDGINKIS